MGDREYCRHCGENKGHTTAACKNLAAIKRTLALVDAELSSATDAAGKLRSVEAELAEIRRNAITLSRIVSCLLDLAELRREHRNA